ncbi:LuxR C-terminal-related transcriptional regulator [Nocardia sp. CNY236]|uniref:LuxR C-terminal-related transcriptional regulator n=1 Tax=Nocardia sp. CNY236 TaxID=1169152 RepID=UPI000687779C|nr:LuxR C-terminal-related transcriptional regulator [Nocardia sp. CNY236]
MHTTTTDEDWPADNRNVITAHDHPPMHDSPLSGWRTSTAPEVVGSTPVFRVVGGPPTLRCGLATIFRAAGMHPAVGPVDEDSSDSAGSTVVTVAVHDRGELPRPFIPTSDRLQIAIAAAYEERTLVAALAAGYHGALDLAASPEAITIAVRAAVSGQCTLPYDVARRLALGCPTPDDTLGAREVTWLNRLVAGSSVLELAESEALSERAMYRRLSAIYQRLGVDSRSEAIAVASRAGLLGDRSAWQTA